MLLMHFNIKMKRSHWLQVEMLRTMQDNMLLWGHTCTPLVSASLISELGAHGEKAGDLKILCVSFESQCHGMSFLSAKFMLHGMRTWAEQNATWCIKTCTPRLQYVSEQWIVISDICSSVNRIICKSLSGRLCSLNAYIIFLLSKVCPLQHLHSVTCGRLNGMLNTLAQWEHSVYQKPKLKEFWFSQVSLTEERDKAKEHSWHL